MRDTFAVRSATPLWAAMMRELRRRDRPLDPPEESERLVRREVCAETGLLASRLSPSRISELFLKGTEPKEDSANWFAADGKLLLPAEYAGWCASSNNTRGAHPRPKAGIINPVANARYEIDPVLPRSQQMIELTATLGDRVQWFINGTQIAPQSNGRFFWQVAPGQWNIRAIGPAGSAEETIFIE
jgi:membrane carboxypeptidase/penicillin-binding protein PbpC